MPAIWLIILFVFLITMCYLSVDKVQEIFFLRKEKLLAQKHQDSHHLEEIEVAYKINLQDLIFKLLLTVIITAILLAMYSSSSSVQP